MRKNKACMPGFELCVLVSVMCLFWGGVVEPARAQIRVGNGAPIEGAQSVRPVWSPNGITIPPEADFTADPPRGIAPLAVDFQNKSKYASFSSWSFGDGKKSSDESPSHKYIRPGRYTVSLTVRNGDMKDTKTALINKSSNAVDYWWDFGDGATSVDQNPTHEYTRIGSFKVSLTAKNVDLTDTAPKEGFITVTKTDFETEPNNGKEHADELTPDVPMNAQLSSTTDVDCFYLNTVAQDYVPVIFQYRFYTGDSDPYCDRYHVSVYDYATDILLAGMPVYTTEEAELTVNFVAEAENGYYIRVEKPLDTDPEPCLLHTNDPYTLIASFTKPSAPVRLAATPPAGPSVARRGYPLAVAFEIRNQGFQDAESFAVGLYLSKAKKVDPDRDQLLASQPVRRLKTGVRLKKTLHVPIPVQVTPGSYYLGILVDGPEIIAEIDAINDSKAASREIRIVE